MKKRRSTILAFLLCATLVLGIGYAAVSDTLLITGTATYNPQSVVKDRVDAAIKFTDATAGAYCTGASYTNDSADMVVRFNDVDDGTKKFEGQATYVVTYDTTDTNYPKAEVTATATLTKSVGSAEAAPLGYSIDVRLVYDDPADAAAGMLSPGKTMQVIVTVTYDTNVSGWVAPSAAQLATIGVELTFDTQGASN